MLKKNLITAAILGAMVAAAGAESEEKVEKAKRFQEPQPEFVLDAPRAACGANATETQNKAVLGSFLEQRTSSQLEELGAYSVTNFRVRRCYACGWTYCCF